MNEMPAWSSSTDYTMGYNHGGLEFLEPSEGADIFSYLRPRIKAGSRVLDVGCGQGRSLDFLARATFPGEVYAIDIEEIQVAAAEKLDRESNLKNTFVTVGNALELPFEDEFFDLVHFNVTLAHIPDTLKALAEVKRVLKPGGLIACREMIIDSSFAYPETVLGRRGWDVFVDLLEADDGHPQMGKEMKVYLLEAGFTNLQLSASFEVYSDREDINTFYHLIKEWFLSPEITEAAKKYGAGSESIFKQVDTEMDNWRKHPGAVAAIAYGQAIAVRP